jgi:hypothetical protein
MHLIDILMRKTKSSQILYLCLFFFFPRLLFIYISMFICKFHTQFRKRQEKCRESFQSLFFNEKSYYSSFLLFFARIFILHYISIVLYFFYLYFRCLCFFILFWSIIYIFFLLFFNFLFFYFLFYINQFQKKTRERVSIHCFSMKNYTIVILFLYFFSPITIIFNFQSMFLNEKLYCSFCLFFFFFC